MIGVNRKKHIEAVETPESEVFKKCFICRTRPASIRCADCLKEHRAELMCYGCSRKVHNEKQQHAYEYATFRDMLVQEEDRSFQETDSFPASSLLKMEAKSGQMFYEDENDRMTQEGSLISAVDVFVHHQESPGKKQYQTFGRRSDRANQGRSGESPSKNPSKNFENQNKENRARVLLHGDRTPNPGHSQNNYSDLVKQKVQDGSANLFHLKPHNPVQPTQINVNSLKRNEDLIQARDTEDRKHRLPPRNERSILRELNSNTPIEKSPIRMESMAPQSKPENNQKHSQSSKSSEILPILRDQDSHSPHKVSDFSRFNNDSSKGYTPTKSATKGGHENRLLTGSCWKSKSKGAENQPQLLHSPAYIDSITELHRTEIESIKTKHRVEVDRLESELSTMSKTYENEIRALKEGAKDTNEELSELHSRVDDSLPD